MEEESTRPLTAAERVLARWMLENGKTEAHGYLAQFELAEATEWKCPCGCASFNFRIKGQPKAPPGVHILGDYLVGDGDSLSGVFIYSGAGVLSGVELYGLVGDAPSVLPVPWRVTFTWTRRSAMTSTAQSPNKLMRVFGGVGLQAMDRDAYQKETASMLAERIESCVFRPIVTDDFGMIVTTDFGGS